MIYDVILIDYTLLAKVLAIYRQRLWLLPRSQEPWHDVKSISLTYNNSMNRLIFIGFEG